MKLRSLALALFLALPLQAEPAFEQAEADFQSRVRMDGAPVSRGARLPPSALDAKSVVLAPEGLIVPLEEGFMVAEWSQVSEVQIADSRVVLMVGPKGSWETYAIRLQPREDVPCVRDGAGFVSALKAALGLRRVGADSEGEYYEPGPEREAIPQTPLSFPLRAGAPAWRQFWTEAELASLSSRAGVTVGGPGIAVVTPNEVLLASWDRAREIDVYDGLPGVSAPQLSVFAPPPPGQIMGHGIVLNAEDEFFLSPAAMASLANLLRGLQGETGPPRLAESVFFPFSTFSPHWADRSPVEPEKAVVVNLDPAPDLWPDDLTQPGIYLVPEGVMVARDYVVDRLPWGSIRTLDGTPDGAMMVGDPLLDLFPKGSGETPAFRCARREIVSAAGLRATGRTSPLYERGDEAAALAPHMYPLVSSSWLGLPLASLGGEPWRSGLYLTRDGVISVQDQRVGMAPWEDVEKIAVAEWDSDGNLYLRAQLPVSGFRAFPTGATGPEVNLADPFAAMRALDKYYLAGDAMAPLMRPYEERPEETIFLPYAPKS